MLDCSAVESEAFEALLELSEADKDLSDDLLDCSAADRDWFDALLEVALVESEADLLEVASSVESWVAVALVDRLSVLVWFSVRLLSLDFEASREVSRLLLLEPLLVTSDEVESVAEMLAPRL